MTIHLHLAASFIICIAHAHNEYHLCIGKGRRIKTVIVTPEKAALVTGTTLRIADPVPADSRE